MQHQPSLPFCFSLVLLSVLLGSMVCVFVSFSFPGRFCCVWFPSVCKKAGDLSVSKGPGYGIYGYVCVVHMLSRAHRNELCESWVCTFACMQKTGAPGPPPAHIYICRFHIHEIIYIPRSCSSNTKPLCCFARFCAASNACTIATTMSAAMVPVAPFMARFN